MAQHALNQFGAGQSGGSGVDPNDLAMSGAYTASYSNTFNGDNNASNGFIGDDELFDGLGSPTDHMPNQPGMHGHGQDFGMNDMNMGYQGIYTAHHNGTGLHMDQTHMNGYSNTPDGDPIQSPFVHSYSQPPFRQMQHPQSFGNSLQSPVSYSGSPMTSSDMNNDGNDPNYLNAKSRPQLSHAMQRKASNTRSPLTPKAAAMSGLAMGSRESPGYGAQPIRTPGAHQDKSPSNQWMHTPTSLSSFPGSGFSSPMQHGMPNPQIADVLMKGGTSMPAKLNGPNVAVSPQEAMKKKRRRESHNLVERRRRDNINERIQDLSRLVPTHRLEDEKIRKLIQNGTPLSPSLTGISHPAQATSGLAGPGAKRATGAGNITTGLPLEEKDKGPNKGDILNGAVSWTRDLMWMLHLKLQQQEELINTITDLGGRVPLELTDDERRMQTELMEAMTKNGPHTFSYSRYSGSGLRVPQHTDYKGDTLNGSDHAITSVSPDENELGDLVDPGHFWNDAEDDGSGPASINFKEEDEYGMDFTQD